ncbi:MAG: hypothetical protein ACI8ZN_002532 [Bacteroidia bacterium]|jgi:hypothetical protein
MEQKFKQQRSTEAAELKKKEEAFQKQQEEFAQLKKRENELFKERLAAKEAEQERTIREKLKLEVDKEQSEQIALIQKELNEKSEQVKELNKTKAEIERMKREKDELKEKLELENQKKLNIILLEEREKYNKQAGERFEMREKELIKQLEDQKKLTEEMKRKQEQGSMQLQGEVQELAIEEYLTNVFPLDSIEEIKKGARGGDCLQVVNTRTRLNCGTIYYESKRTKDFQPTWIEKFKNDIRERNAGIGVLVTEVMPSDMDRMGLKDGIWICTYEEFKGLCKVLRESIIQLSAAKASQENRGDKMSVLYDFLTSNAFKLQIEGIVDGFTQMQIDLDSEKRSMQRIWKSREKQIERVITNTIDMYGSIKGIAGSAIAPIKSLELGGGEDDDG